MFQRKKYSAVYEAAVKVTKSLDAFPKIDEDYKETSSTRGTLTVFVLMIISSLVFFEVNFFLKDHIRYRYEVDVDYTSKLKLKIDMTVATSCKSISDIQWLNLRENTVNSGKLSNFW